MKALPILLAGLMLAACSDLHIGNIQQGQALNTITVSGEGEVQRTPDRFMLRATAARSGDDIGALKQQLDRDISAALSMARELGIDERQLRADSLSVQPEWEWQPQRRLTGYRVSRTLNATSNSLETHAGLLEGLARLGFSEIQPLGSTLADPAEAEAEALQAAMKSARKRAETLARAGGRELGEALIIEQQGSAAARPMAMAAMRADSEEAWTPGETRIQRQVQVTYALR